MKRAISGTVSALMIASSIPAVASAADQQTRGNVGGYDYEMWNQNGQGQVSMEPGAGSFTCSWSNIENFLARMGKNYDSQGKNYKEIGNIVLTYDVEYTPRGNSYMCVYGWTKSPLVEYYIVEGWGDWRPPGNDGENKGSVTLNGNTYDIRKSMRYNQPSLEGTSTFPQYWSVRQTSGSANNQTNYMKGTIDVSKHFDAWSQAGLDMSGKLYEVSLNIEGYRSNGSANVKSVTVSTDGSGAGASDNNNQQQAQNNDWNNQWNNQQQNNDWNNQWNNQQQNNDWNNQWNNQQQNNDWNNQWNNQQQNNDWNNQWNNQQQNNDWNNQWNNQQQNNDWNNQWNDQQQNNDWNNQWNDQQQNNDWNNQWNNQQQNNDWNNQWNNGWNNDWANNVTKWGDANGDNSVDMGDTVSIMQSLANPDKYNLNQQGAYNGDVFNPGSGITNSDAQSLQMFFLGMIPNLPYGDNNWNNQWNNQQNWNQNNDWNNQNQQQNWNQNNDWNNQNQQQNWNQNNDWNNQNQQQNWNQNNDWNNQNQQQNWNQNNDWNNQNQQQNWNQNNDWNNQNQQQNWNQNNDWNNQNQQQNWNQNNDWNNQNQQQNNSAVPAGTEMNKSATMADDFRTGSSRYFIASDGWENGDPFDCGWYASQTGFSDGTLNLTIDKDHSGKYNYAGAEYRTNDFYSYGYYETSMKPIKNTGVNSSFFTYTGESDGNPWDEIDIEFLGKDTTKVQFNYYTNGQGNHEFMYDLGFDASQGFHTYGFDWQPDHITWYVDGKAVYTANQNIPKTPGKIMMNAWPGRGVDEWLGHYDGRTPLTARYQWVTYTKK